MSKKMIAIPQGNLMRVAASKGHDTLSALKEKTGVDRKTLRAIEAGRPIKETTLQSIADRLRVPMAHLDGTGTVETNERPRNDSVKYRELRLQRLDAATLRKRAHHDINWILKVDRISEDQETLLRKLHESLNLWVLHLELLDDDSGENLIDQISYIKRSTDIDKCVEELEQCDLKILGGTFVRWDSCRGLFDGKNKRALPILSYRSRLVTALAIVPKTDNNSTMRVFIGLEPPQKFNESQLTGIDLVFVDGDVRWARNTEWKSDFSPEEQELIDNARLLHPTS